MKCELLTDGAAECPLVRGFDFSRSELERLLALVEALAGGAVEGAEFESIGGVELLGGLRLELRVGPRDVGCRRLASEPLRFELSRDGWDHVADLAAPFVSGSDGFQWLSDAAEARHARDAADGFDGVAVLLSGDGRW